MDVSIKGSVPSFINQLYIQLDYQSNQSISGINERGQVLNFQTRQSDLIISKIGTYVVRDSLQVHS